MKLNNLIENAGRTVFVLIEDPKDIADGLNYGEVSVFATEKALVEHLVETLMEYDGPEEEMELHTLHDDPLKPGVKKEDPFEVLDRIDTLKEFEAWTKKHIDLITVKDWLNKLVYGSRRVHE